MRFDKTILYKWFCALITVKSCENNTRTLSDKIFELIAQKITDSTTTITSYIELEEQTEEKIAYRALYLHCRWKFETKLKVARKSHYKKDPNGEVFFKNPRRTV